MKGLIPVLLELIKKAAGRIFRNSNRVKIANQQRYVEAWEDACQAHPGMYEAELERERAKLDGLRQ